MLVGNTPTDTAPGGGSTSPSTPSTTDTKNDACVQVTSGTEPIATGAIPTDAISLSGEIFTCADHVVVVAETDLNEVIAAAQLAAALKGPLLFPHARLAAEIGRLSPANLHVIGEIDVPAPPGTRVVHHTAADALEQVQDELDTDTVVNLPAQPDATSIVETVLAIDTGDRVAVPAPSDGTTATPDISVPELVSGLATNSDAESLWMVDATDPATILFSAASVHAVGAAVVAVDADNLLGYPDLADTLKDRDPSDVRFIGGVPEASDWELAVLTSGVQVPGGGFQIFPEDRLRRYFAFYGHPATTGLGVLGEQGNDADSPQRTRDRMQPWIEQYKGDGAEVVATFEMIVSVAAAEIGDGDYSREWAPDAFLPWIDFAAENDMYVIIDLQPGRDDFLNQAKQYESLLLNPHVGLALDPEWRLGPEQVHLKQVGRVEAAEVNTVIHWLADLVRDNGLPQKMLIVHQFWMSMIQNRSILEERPELQLVIQMDGQGPEWMKDESYEVLTKNTEDSPWRWGWKNFFDEDTGGPPTPESTMNKKPKPVFVSYQ